MSAPTDLLAEASLRLGRVGRALWFSVLIGNPPPMTLRLRDRMKDPRPGDVVLEVTKFHGADDPDTVGTLIRRVSDSSWVVEPLHRPGLHQTWDNAQFVALPANTSADRFAEELFPAASLPSVETPET